jgi:hypothetical protein
MLVQYLHKWPAEFIQPAIYANMCAGFSLILPIRVTAVAGIAIIGVPTHSIMIIIGLWVGMAAQTIEGGKITSGMTICTGIPFVLVRSAKNGEIVIVMLKVNLTPFNLIMAIGTGCRESHR